jgi:hypothetical protein
VRWALLIRQSESKCFRIGRDGHHVDTPGGTDSSSCTERLKSVRNVRKALISLRVYCGERKRTGSLAASAARSSMAVERASAGSSFIDTLDRVLDKGIVIDAWARITLAGIDLVTVEARVTVASIETRLRHCALFVEPAPAP